MPPSAVAPGGSELWRAAHTERRRDVRQIILEARCNDIVQPGGADLVKTVKRVTIKAMRSHEPGALGDFRIASDKHPAFTGCDRFVGVEAEDTGI